MAGRIRRGTFGVQLGKAAAVILALTGMCKPQAEDTATLNPLNDRGVIEEYTSN
jgi:hypothetical protein